MNPLGLVARIVAAVAIGAAVVFSFVPHFLTVSFDFDGPGGGGYSAGFSAWHRLGGLGAMALLCGVVVAVVAASLPTSQTLARRLLAGMASAIAFVAGGLLVLYVLIEQHDAADGIRGMEFGLGWSGFVVLGLTAFGTVAGVVAALLADHVAPSPAQPPPPWA